MLSFSFGFGLPLTSRSTTEEVPHSKAKRENVPPQKETPNQSLKKESVKRATHVHENSKSSLQGLLDTFSLLRDKGMDPLLPGDPGSLSK